MEELCLQRSHGLQCLTLLSKRKDVLMENDILSDMNLIVLQIERFVAFVSKRISKENTCPCSWGEFISIGLRWNYSTNTQMLEDMHNLVSFY